MAPLPVPVKCFCLNCRSEFTANYGQQKYCKNAECIRERVNGRELKRYYARKAKAFRRIIMGANHHV